MRQRPRPAQPKRSCSRGRRSAAAPGPSSEHVALEPAQADGRLARVLAADEVGGGGRLVGDRDLGRVQRRPAESGRPRQSSSGARPAQPIATSPGPTRQARPNESAITTAQPSRARAAPAPTRPGRRKQHRASSPPAFDWSTPAFAHTKPWRVRAISRPASARTSSALSDRISSTRRGSLPCSAASARARRRAGRRRAHDPPLGLRDGLVRDGEDVARAQAAPGAWRPSSSAARSSPGGSPAAPAAARRRAGHAPPSSPPGRRAAAAGQRHPAGDAAPCRARASAAPARASAAQRGEVARRVDVELERRRLRDAHARPAAAPRGVARERAGPNAGLDRARRREPQRVRARAVPVGHDHHVRRRRSRRAAADLARVERRAVARDEQHARSAPRAARRSPRAAAADWPASTGRRPRARPRRAPPPPRRGSAVTTITSSSPGTRAQRVEHVADHRGGQRRRGRADRPPSPRRCLARPKDLTGRTAAVRIARRRPAQRERELERLVRDPAARVGVGHRDVGLERRQRVGALVGHEPVEQPVVARRSRRSRAAGRPTRGTPRSAPSATGRRRAARPPRPAGHDARSASRIPGTARIGPIEMTGFDGPMTTARARASASSTCGVGAASARRGTRRPRSARPRARGS